MQQDQSERRKHVRRAVLLPCKVEGAWAHGTMQIVDLSVGGCFVATRETIPAGTQITLHAKLAGTEVRFTGRVVHMQGGRGFARGLIFRRDGTLAASVAQEGLIRTRRPTGPA